MIRRILLNLYATIFALVLISVVVSYWLRVNASVRTEYRHTDYLSLRLEVYHGRMMFYFANEDLPISSTGYTRHWWGSFVLLRGTQGVDIRLGLAGWLVILVLSVCPMALFIRGSYRRYRRCKKGLCLKCSYNLTGNVSGVCPECGEQI